LNEQDLRPVDVRVKRLSAATLGLLAALGLWLATARVVVADRPAPARVTSIAVDPHAARALEGVRITFLDERSGASLSCTTDAEGGCTISRRFPGTHLVVFATQDGRRGPPRDIVIPRSGIVLVYVAVPTA
jgi:hypothetical protein